MVNLEINMRIKRVFINLIILILGNFQDHYIHEEESEFDYDAYLEEVAPENRDFYSRFIKTQMFNAFIQD